MPGGAQGSGLRLSVAATVEPDVDGDGYGDTTQDRCPSQANTQGLCSFSFGRVGAPSGTATVGKKLTAPSLTVPAGATRAYQWYRVFTVKSHGHSRVVKQRIYGATGAKYTLKSKDKGKRVFVQIKVTAPNYNPATVNSRSKKVH